MEEYFIKRMKLAAKVKIKVVFLFNPCFGNIYTIETILVIKIIPSWVLLPNLRTHARLIKNSSKSEILEMVLKLDGRAIKIAGMHIFRVKKEPIRVADTGILFQIIGMLLSICTKPPLIILSRVDIMGESEKRKTRKHNIIGNCFSFT